MENGTKEKQEKQDKKFDKLYNKAEMYGITKKTLFSVISIFSTILIIFAIAFTQAGFDITKFEEVSYWIRFAILCGLSIWGMINGQQIGDDISRNNPNGAFRKTLSRYGNICTSLDAGRFFAYFEDWLIVYRQKKLRKKIERVLSDNNINQYAVLDLDLTDLDMLKTPFKKDWKGTDFEGKYKNDETYFRSYSDEQIQVIKYCIEGKVKVSNLPASFFVSVYQQSDKDMWESSVRANQKKTLFVGSNYVFKAALMLTSSFLFNGLVSGWKDGFNVVDALLDLASQLFNMFMGVVLGVFLGYNIVKIDLTYLEFKVSILKQYKDELEANIFVPQTEEEKAKAEYDETHKKTKKQDVQELSVEKKIDNKGEEIDGRKEDDEEGAMD